MPGVKKHRCSKSKFIFNIFTGHSEIQTEVTKCRKDVNFDLSSVFFLLFFIMKVWYIPICWTCWYYESMIYSYMLDLLIFWKYADIFLNVGSDLLKSVKEMVWFRIFSSWFRFRFSISRYISSPDRSSRFLRPTPGGTIITWSTGANVKTIKGLFA